jgi:multisubunit Na+/H+ antiporter MnhF subunit
VNAYLIGATILLAGLVPCWVVALRSRPIDGVVAVQAAGSVVTVVLLCLAEGFHRTSYFTVPLVLSAMSLVGGLVYARFIDRLG